MADCNKNFSCSMRVFFTPIHCTLQCLLHLLNIYCPSMPACCAVQVVFSPTPPPHCQPGIQTQARQQGADVPAVELISLWWCFTAPLASKAQTFPSLLLPCCCWVLAQLAESTIRAIDHKLYASIW
jgi:hypothetical protein